jgi:murein DD-endopeptidase MepM/ murein hydrolase activator NlpD
MPRLLVLTCALALLGCSSAALADAEVPAVRTGGSVAATPKAGGTRYGVGTAAERAAARARRRAAARRARELAARARERAAQERRRQEAARRRRQASAGDGVFPVTGGDWSYGDRFGVPRPGGRTHMGQDVPAPEGTPLVSPRDGTVTDRGYQEGGAGNYLAVKDASRDVSYVFMHLVTGSLRVGEGDRVARGEQIGRVGSTGDATGPHLHFEVWIGGYADGRAVDPLPYLKRWEGD